MWEDDSINRSVSWNRSAHSSSMGFIFLADRALRKKENNKLYIQIELIRRELKNNDEQLSSFIDSFMRKKDLDKALEFPLMFMKSFLIDMLDELQVIKESYMRSGPYLVEFYSKAIVLH